MILITGKTYDYLKFLVQVALPALGAAYFALAGIWGLPSAEQVVGTIVVIDGLLGTLLQLSSTAYAKSDARFDGKIHVIQGEDGKKTFDLRFDGDPVQEIAANDTILFKVTPEAKALADK